MKQVIFICVFSAFAFACEAQIQNDSSYTLTPLEKELYRDAITKGRGQKALGSIIIVGGAALGTVGAGLALSGIENALTTDEYGEDVENLRWKGGTAMLILGVATIIVGGDMVKKGKQNVREGKVSLKLDSKSVGLLVRL